MVRLSIGFYFGTYTARYPLFLLPWPGTTAGLENKVGLIPTVIPRHAPACAGTCKMTYVNVSQAPPRFANRMLHRPGLEKLTVSQFEYCPGARSGSRSPRWPVTGLGSSQQFGSTPANYILII